MLTLRLFGGLSLEDSERPVPVRATQRQRLALLAILADSLYVLREALGDDLFRMTGDFVALDPERITSDVAELGRALCGWIRGSAWCVAG